MTPVGAEETHYQASTLMVVDENPSHPAVPDVPSQQEHEMMTPVGAEETWSLSGVGFFVGAALYQ